MLKHVSFFLIQFVCLSQLLASEPILLQDSVKEIDLTNFHYDLLKDTSGTLTIENVSSQTLDSRFYHSDKDYNYVEDPYAVYWLRFRIQDHTTENKKWVLEYLSVHTEDLEIFIPKEDGRYQSKKIGQLLPFGIRDYKVSNFVFDLPSGISDSDYFYIRIQSRHSAGFEFKIRSQYYFTSYAIQEYYFLGLYYGILLIMAVYNLLLFFSSKEKVYLFYVLYVLSCMLNSFAEDGLGFQFIWPAFPSWNWNLNNHLSSAFFLLSFVFYSSSFLELKKYSSLFLKLVYGSTFIYFIFNIIALVFPTLDFSFLYIIPFLIVYCMALYLYWKGYKPARYFILGYSFVFISILIIQLRNHTIIPHNILTVYSFNYGVLLEVVVLSFALGDRIRILKLDKEQAQKYLIAQLEENQLLQQKVNRELEEKVNQRTKLLSEKTSQLEEANEKLRKMTEELNKFASKLDLDNWELNKRVIDEKKARMNLKELSFEEFTNIFPNDFSCLKYVEEIKWGGGYQCKKCGHDRFAQKPKLLARKCSRCNYIESVTSGTIFHAVKFPIQKAFFIAYISTRKQNKIPADKLAEMLQLNKLTCYKFRKKILSRETLFLEKNKKDRLESWENLILE